MIVVDANIVIAASTPNHVHHTTAREIALEHGRAGMVMHSLTMAEVLVGPARAGAETEAHRRLIKAGFVLAPDGDPSPEHVARVRASTGLRMPDACVLAMAEAAEAPLATFDKHLAREAGDRGIALLA